jgi:drug/metabolite transporter (DMT)-like permease
MHRSGSEPVQARSPLRLRLTLAVCGVVWGIAAAVGFALLDHPGWAALCAVIAALAAVDTAVVIRRIRQGPHYQPGRDVPPYRPVEHDPVRPPGRRHWR